jgi:hypothetical protein
MENMRANVFRGIINFHIEEVEKPHAGAGEALIRVTLTTICGTDLHIVRGEYPVKPGLVIGHEPVGVIEELGTGVTGYEIGAGRGDHSVRPVPRLPFGSALAMRSRRRLRSNRRLAVRQHDQRRAGRISAGA